MGAKSCVVALGLATLACGATDGTRDTCTRPGGRAVRGLAAGLGHSVAVLENGDVRLWGALLGYGRPRLSPPVAVDTGCRNAVEVAAGSHHACLRLDDGQVRCWGRNDAGQLGFVGDTLEVRPARPAELGAATALAAGHQHTCARLADGQLRCFGAGVLDGESGNRLIPFGEGRTVNAIGAGHGHTCAVLDNHELRCWGANDDGQLGLGDRTTRPRPVEAVNLGPGRALAIAAGRHFTCARLDDGAVKCWGLNDDGQLGLGDTVTRLAPTAAVALGAPAVQIAAGFASACARLDDGTVKCWGANGSGQAGVGDCDPHPRPSKAVDLGTGKRALEIASGWIHVCARLDDGTVKCWGDNDSRQLGIPDPLARGDTPDELGDNLPPVPLD